MKCPIETQENTEWLLEYSARSLDAERTALLEEHMQSCPACREFAGSQGAVWQTLDRWEAPEVSADFDRRLYERIEQEVSWWDRLTRPFRPLLVRQGLPVAAAACLVLVAGFLLQHPGGIPLPRVPESAQLEVAPEQIEHTIDEMETIREFNKLMRAESADSKM